MRIGELAEKTGVSRDAIRFYERLGLISSERGQEGRYGYRHYPASAIRRLSLIGQAKALGFTLVELKELLDAWADFTLEAEQKRAILGEKIKAIDSKISLLQATSNELKKTLAGIKDQC